MKSYGTLIKTGKIMEIYQFLKRGDNMSFGFPMYIHLQGNTCVVFGGGDFAADKVEQLLRFGAKVTVISPMLCARLKALDVSGDIRYLPRKYNRGDCTSAMLCVAATNNEAVNIAISVECKAKSIPVHLSRPADFGNFTFPETVLNEHVQLSMVGDDPAFNRHLAERLETLLPEWMQEWSQKTT
jgi:uroporphyrin-III C-methyltransferase/precorrin-2 dehydrogenase/sirohydrochlorin ferrochelatase